jgi:DNA (cytosine-5)-methyltransferase 1
MNYYNEFDPYAAQWLRNLIDAGHIARGEVDTRSIKDVRASDLTGFVQCHFFAGLGGWSHALRLAGWPEDRPVWTGSCPCQPFSAAGAQKGTADDRHLWPVWFNLIRECRPELSLVSKLKQRLTTDGSTLFKLTWREKATPAGRLVSRLAASARRISDNDFGSWPTPKALDGRAAHGPHDGSANAPSNTFANANDSVADQRRPTLASWPTPNTPSGPNVKSTPTHTGWMDLEGAATLASWPTTTTRTITRAVPGGGAAGTTRSARTRRWTWRAISFWSDCDWLPCRDGKARPVEPGTFPLAHGAPPEWDACAPTAMPSSRKSRKSS